MSVISFKLDEANRISSDTGGYFVKYTKQDNKYWVLPSECPHRSGPLHLGKQCRQTGAIVCPWHENRISMRCLKRNSMPVVVNRDTINIVFSDDSHKVWKEFHL
ncbi:Rieske 2Fe-2S domain-containing protein [Photobacterium rosenbergii]|uniref:Rieske 2Fe-2S domain-containing protein n=1 Tax=Photobacterium rosenbergii TaxID=294936 RepID=UPI003982A5B0